MKLTNLQRIILVIYTIAIISICIFFAPRTLILTENNNTFVIPIGYDPIWVTTNRYTPKSVNDIDFDNFVRIDYYRMFVEVFVITVVAGTLFALSMFPREKPAQAKIDATSMVDVTQKKKIPWWGWMLIAWGIFPGAFIIIFWIIDLISRTKGGF
jgi:hypothetical protein